MSHESSLPRDPSENPLRHAPQTSYGRRWCLICRETRNTKGGSIKGGMFRCQLHQPKEPQA